LFAGHVLDDPGFFDAVRSGRFSEDDQVYRSVVTGQALFGLGCSDEQYWMTTRLNKGKRDCRDPYGYIDGGGHEIGEAYQKCCTAKPWKYTALAIDLLGLREAWGNDAFFEYVDRWVSQGVQALPDPCAPFNGDAKAYGKAYGPALSKGCVKGGGRYPEKHAINADTGFYDHKFGEAMWARFKK
jgi:hypothetical protein